MATREKKKQPASQVVPKKDGPPVQRSPRYPAFDLEKAIERAGEFHKANGKNAVDQLAAMSSWGYTSINGRSLRCLATVLAFGLLEKANGGSPGKVKLSDLGRKIVLLTPPNNPERLAAIRTAAVRPKIHREMLEQWPDELPSDTAIQNYLTVERQFNLVAAVPLIQEFKATYAFAKLAGSGTITDGEDDESSADDALAEDRGGESSLAPMSAALPGGSPPRQKGPAMNTEFLDLPVPLIGGGRAVLRLPIPLTAENYVLLTTMLKTSLEGLRKAIVRESEEKSED